MEQLRNNEQVRFILDEARKMAHDTKSISPWDRFEHLFVALSQFGVKEIVGGNHNPVILDYFAQIGHDWVKDDETAWCSAFVNWVMKMSNKPYSGKLNARSWMDVGAPTDNPVMGDIVVLWRESPDSWKGHVGIFIRRTVRHIYVLGGNQQNQVNILAYKSNRLLGYRRI